MIFSFGVGECVSEFYPGVQSVIQVPAFVKVPRKTEIVKDHLESEISDVYFVLLQLLAEERLHCVRCFSPEFGVVTSIEGLGVARFQRVVQLGPV